jgi:molybdopterin/thiamine biosynthesis adenylyltransferase
MPEMTAIMGADSARFSRERLAGYSEEMLQRRLLLVGAGALGDALAELGMKWGFRQALIVDCDRYEQSNATRVLDFPYEKVRRGVAAYKALEVALAWRRRLARAGIECAGVGGRVGFGQEIPPWAWLQADVVLCAVDHVRARRDVAMLARRYGKPVVMGGFDALTHAITVQFYPATRHAACVACTEAEEPTYAASDTSCTTIGRRAAEQRKVPATANMAAACAALMFQELVDGLMRGFPASAHTTQLYLGPRTDRSLGRQYQASASPGCPYHSSMPPVNVPLRGRTMGTVLRALERRFPECLLELPAALPIHAPGTDRTTLVRIALPPWRCPADLTELPEAPDDAYPLALTQLDHHLAAKHGLLEMPAAWLGLGPEAVFELTIREGGRLACRWVPEQAQSRSRKTVRQCAAAASHVVREDATRP